MKVGIKMEGLEKVQKQLAALSGPQIKQAMAKALNDTAYKVRKSMQDEMREQFDRPTPYMLKSVHVKEATPENLEAEILPTYFGGKGVDPQKIIKTEESGGRRADKRSEVALRRVGILPPGYQTAIPKTPFPGSDDGRGNLKGSFIVRLISYFQAFGEQGYRSNMTARAKKKLADRAKYSSLWNKQTYESARGVEFFVAKQADMPGVHDAKNKTMHLQPGIWAKSGLHGSTGIYRIWPVLIFVKMPNYRPRFVLARIKQRADVDNYLQKRIRRHIYNQFEALK